MPQHQSNEIRHIKKYVNEFFEALISLLVIKLAMEKEIKIWDIIQTSLIIGTFTFILETYSPEFKSNVVSGLTFTVGSVLATKMSSI